MPVDVVKTRLQMDGSGGAVKQYAGSLDCAGKLVKADGPSALFKGLPPALVRQSTYGSLRYGLYGPIKNSMGIKAGEKVPLWKKIVAGGGAGAIASAVANPTDLLKVRLQTDGMAKDAEGNLLPKRYSGMVSCFTTTVKEVRGAVFPPPSSRHLPTGRVNFGAAKGARRLLPPSMTCTSRRASQEGILALWTGVGPTVGRATALAAAELATYDEVKTQLLGTGYFQPGLLLTITTAFASGYVSTVASCAPTLLSRARVRGTNALVNCV